MLMPERNRNLHYLAITRFCSHQRVYQFAIWALRLAILYTVYGKNNNTATQKNILNRSHWCVSIFYRLNDSETGAFGRCLRFLPYKLATPPFCYLNEYGFRVDQHRFRRFTETEMNSTHLPPVSVVDAQ